MFETFFLYLRFVYKSNAMGRIWTLDIFLTKKAVAIGFLNNRHLPQITTDTKISVNIVSLIVHTFYLDTICSLPLHQSYQIHIDVLYRIPNPWVYIVHYHISILEYQSIDIFSPVRKLPLKENKYLKEAL